MVLPFILPAVAALVGRQIGKSGAEKDADEKIDAIKQMVDLTPDQTQAIDAIQRQPIQEVRARLELGVGPLAPLPPQASERAQEIRNLRIAAAQSPEQASAISDLVSKKRAEAQAAIGQSIGRERL